MTATSCVVRRSHVGSPGRVARRLGVIDPDVSEQARLDPLAPSEYFIHRWAPLTPAVSTLTDMSWFNSHLAIAPSSTPSFDWTRIPISDATPEHVKVHRKGAFSEGSDLQALTKKLPEIGLQNVDRHPERFLERQKAIEREKFVRPFDWASTALGPIETWSADLRQMCNLIIAIFLSLPWTALPAAKKDSGRGGVKKGASTFLLSLPWATLPAAKKDSGRWVLRIGRWRQSSPIEHLVGTSCPSLDRSSQHVQAVYRLRLVRLPGPLLATCLNSLSIAAGPPSWTAFRNMSKLFIDCGWRALLDNFRHHVQAARCPGLSSHCRPYRDRSTGPCPSCYRSAGSCGLGFEGRRRSEACLFVQCVLDNDGGVGTCLVWLLGWRTTRRPAVLLAVVMLMRARQRVSFWLHSGVT